MSKINLTNEDDSPLEVPIWLANQITPGCTLIDPRYQNLLCCTEEDIPIIIYIDESKVHKFEDKDLILWKKAPEIITLPETQYELRILEENDVLFLKLHIDGEQIDSMKVC